MADDWTRINSREIVRRALIRLEAKGKGILLLHDIQPATALGLPELLAELKVRGYRVVHVVPSSAARPATVTTADQWLVRHPPTAQPRAERLAACPPAPRAYVGRRHGGAECHELRCGNVRGRRSGVAGGVA